MKKIIECVPNFSVGQDLEAIDKIAQAIQSVPNVTLKCIDTGKSANRSVFTFLGEENAILEASYKSIQVALDVIDMKKHRGTHPRMGAVDVFPFVALDNMPQDELIAIVHRFAEQVAMDFKLPTYLYEKSQKEVYRKNLASIRKGDYENLELKLNDPEWKPDFYPYFNPKAGAMAMGVRDILIAFNVNLKTQDVEVAKRIAEEIRHSGKTTVVNGQKIHQKGLMKGVKAIGWYIPDFDKVQVSMNIVDYKASPVAEVYETCKALALKYGTEVTGSELIGCIPYDELLNVGKYYAKVALPEKDLVSIAIKSLNLNEVKPFEVDKNVIYPKNLC